METIKSIKSWLGLGSENKPSNDAAPVAATPPLTPERQRVSQPPPDIKTAQNTAKEQQDIQDQARLNQAITELNQSNSQLKYKMTLQHGEGHARENVTQKQDSVYAAVNSSIKHIPKEERQSFLKNLPESALTAVKAAGARIKERKSNPEKPLAEQVLEQRLQALNTPPSGRGR